MGYILNNLSHCEWNKKFHDHYISTESPLNISIKISEYIFLFKSSANIVLDYFLKQLDSNDIYIFVESGHMTIFSKNEARPGNHLRVLRRFKFEMPRTLNLFRYKSQQILERVELLGLLGPSCDEVDFAVSNSIDDSLAEFCIKYLSNMTLDITLIGSYEILSSFNQLLPKNILDRVQLQIYIDYMDSSSNEMVTLLTK